MSGVSANGNQPNNISDDGTSKNIETLEDNRLKIFNNFILPLEKLKRNLSLMTTTEIILMLERQFMLGNYGRDCGVMVMVNFVLFSDIQCAFSLFNSVIFVLQDIFETRYGELIGKYDSDQIYLMNIECNSLVTLMNTSYYNLSVKNMIISTLGSENVNLLGPIMKNLRSLLLLLIERHSAFYKRKEETVSPLVYILRSGLHETYRALSEVGGSPSNVWNLTPTSGRKVTNMEYIRTVLSNSPETTCAVCLGRTISEDVDFSILNCCPHLFCVQCSEILFFDQSADQR